MKELNIVTPIMAMKDDELTETDRALVMKAREASYAAYAPYSHFSVGAAILLDNSAVVTGANQENAAYPSGLCAERTAAFYAHAQHPDAKFISIAVSARNSNGEETKEPVAPCGACRQVLLEYEKLSGCDMRVILAGANECYVFKSAKSLLPVAFTEF